MEEVNPRELAQQLLPVRYESSQELADRGLSRRDVARLVAQGHLVRLRSGRYASIEVHTDLVRAGTLGARLDCVSLLAAMGIFVHTADALHIQVERDTSRLPSPPKGVVRHWRRSVCERRALSADIRSALAQSVRCQSARDAIATLDSAWYHRIVDEADIAAVFALLPAKYAFMRGLLDRRAESGPETLMRLMLRGLGCHVDVQVWIREVGKVDFVVDGWLIVECDSKAHHKGWAAQKRDRRRDIAAAALGYTTIRPLAEDILYNHDAVLTALKAILAQRAVQNSRDSRPRRRICR